MGRFGQFVKVLGRWLDRLRRALHLLLLLAIVTLIASAVHHPLPIVPSKAALVVHLHGKLVEQESVSALSQSLGAVSDSESQTLLRDVIAAIRGAAKDERIKLMVLDTNDLDGAGLTKLRAIADAVRAFKSSGKPVYAFGRYATQEQYYVMSLADHVYLDPTGMVEVTGYAAYGLYFHDALERLGVNINVFKVGTHKSFTEPFTRQNQSPEDREQTLGWITPLWQTYRADIEAARHLPDGALDTYVAKAVDLLRAADGDAARLAEEQHLVSGRRTQIEFEREISGLVGEDSSTHSYNAIDHEDYVTATGPDLSLSRHPAGNVAVLVAAGEIVNGEHGPGSIGGDTFAGVLREARFDDDVKAVVIRIDSGGGSMLASEVIRQEVDALKAAGKPVVASFSSVAASGGYYIAMDSDEIWASPTTITGSIGVFGLVPTFERAIGKIGVSSDGVATSPIAGPIAVERGLSAETRTLLQLGVEHAYHDFVGKVAKARHKSVDDVEKVAEGRVFVATEAKKYGLVDHLGELDGAVKAAAQRAKLTEGQYGVVFREKELGWKEKLLRSLSAEADGLARRVGLMGAVPPAVRPVLNAADRQLRALERLDDPRRIYAYCGCVVD
jgi:protease IV